ncbi:hypothetical protein HY636_03005 [Candidatus Woesearchaeota archaeon]|nr:hypothetical protein [Candidatus Woesearchaeota archaeon]
MSHKVFIENFWETEQENILYVFMPFDKSFDEKYKIIEEAAKIVGFNGKAAERVDKTVQADQIYMKIIHKIANSKMLLFDLSDDPEVPCGCKKHANSNVIWEFGVALSIREQQDIIIIREKSKSELPFNIRQILRKEYNQIEFTKEWLAEILKNALEAQKWYKSKRVSTIAQSLDPFSIQLIQERGRFPVGNSHFGFNQINTDAKISVSKLIDLGMLKFNWAINDENSSPEYSYDWTPFGRAVMEHKGIIPWTLKEFQTKRPEDYQKLVQQRKEYQ